MALKIALLRLWLETQQQLCLYHINSNVRAYIRSQWKSHGAEEADDNFMTSSLLSVISDDFDENLVVLDPSAPIEYSRDGLLQALKRVDFTCEYRDFEVKWKEICDRFGPYQNTILSYTSKEYMPWREQWAECFIRRYRNFGQRVNSPAETAHKDVKSYLITGTGASFIYMRLSSKCLIARNETIK
jgi:hypothetical protein